VGFWYTNQTCISQFSAYYETTASQNAQWCTRTSWFGQLTIPVTEPKLKHSSRDPDLSTALMPLAMEAQPMTLATHNVYANLSSRCCSSPTKSRHLIDRLTNCFTCSPGRSCNAITFKTSLLRGKITYKNRYKHQSC